MLFCFTEESYPKIIGLDSSVVIDEQALVTCQINFTWTDNAQFAWSLSNKTLPSFPVYRTRNYNMTKYRSILDYDFTREDNGMTLRCSFLAKINHVTYEKSTVEVLDLLCKSNA